MRRLTHSNGIILRRLKYGESSLILDILTEDAGMESYIIGGVRKQKTKYHSGLLQIMNQIQFVAYNANSKGLSRIKEFSLSKIYQNLPYDVYKSAVGQFATEVLHKSLQKSDPHPEMTAFAMDFLDYLDETADSLALLPVVYLIELSTWLGFAPQNNFGADTPYFDLQEGWFSEKYYESWRGLHAEASRLLSELLDTSFRSVHALTVDKKHRRMLLDTMVRYYQLHMDHFKEVKSLDVCMSLWT